MRGRGKHRKAIWWTRDSILAGLRSFYDKFGYCPTDQSQYASHAQFSGFDPVTGRHSNLGWHQKYPSAQTVLRTFPTLREAWEAAGFDVNHAYLEWKPIEDWFIIESLGIIPRDEVAAMLKRSVPSVKRRLYDLGGFTARTRWGIPLSGAAHLLGVPEHVVRRYLDHGIIPYFRGYKLIYLNPADLMLITEVNWDDVPEDVDALVRAALQKRLLLILKHRENWRSHEVYTFQPKGLFRKRIKNRVPVSKKADVPPPPNSISAGDWIKMSKSNALGVAGRVGRVITTHYSPIVCNRRDGSYRACWVARIEFPRLRRTNQANEKRIHYTMPLDSLEKTAAPVEVPKPLSMHPEAVRGRERKAKGEFGTRARINRELIAAEII